MESSQVENLDQFRELKKIGNEDYKEANYKKAKESYLNAIEYISNDERYRMKYAKTLMKIGMIEWKKGCYVDSMQYYRKGMDNLVASNQRNTKLGSYILTMMSINFKLQANLVEAEKLSREAVSIMKSIDEESIMMGRALQTLGWILDEQSRYSESMKILEQALSIKDNYHGKDRNLELASCFNRIGGVFEHQGKVFKAQSYYLKALELKKDYFGTEEHPEVADIYNNIGNVDETLQRYASALKNYNKFLAIYLKFHGDEHPKIADAYLNIGCIYDSLGKYEKSLDSYNKSLQLDLKIFGKNHPRIGETLGNIGCVYLNLEAYDEAHSKYREALSIYQKFYNHVHSKPSDLSFNIGMLMSRKFDLASAKDLYLKCLCSYTQTYGKDHYDLHQIKALIVRADSIQNRLDYSYDVNYV